MGKQVKYLGASQGQINWGGNDDPRPLLTVGSVYEVKEFEPHRWHTKIVLVDYPDKTFNDVSFERV